MAEKHIVIAEADTQDNVYPMAWSVKGGDGTFGNVNIAPANGSSEANVSINNGAINVTNSNISIGGFGHNLSYFGDNAVFSTQGNLRLTTINNTGTVELGGPGNVSIIPGGNVSLSTANSISLSCGGNISLGCGGNVSIGSGDGALQLQGGTNGISITTSNNATMSVGNFNVVGLTNFNSPVAFNSTANFNSATWFRSYTEFNNSATIAVYGNSTTYTKLNVNLAYANISDVNTHTNYSDRGSSVYLNRRIVANVVDPSIRTRGNGKIKGTLNTDRAVFTNLHYLGNNALYTYTNTITTNNFSFGTANNLHLLATVPITDTISVNSLSKNVVVQVNTHFPVSSTIGTGTNFMTLYVELYDGTNSTHYPITLLDSESKARYDGADDTLPYILLEDLTNNSVTELNSGWQFLVYTNPDFMATYMTSGTYICTTTVKLFEPLTAGTGGGGGTVDDTNIYPTYSSSSTYNVNDMALYNGVLHRCITAVTTAEPFDSNKWVSTVLSSEVSNTLNALGGMSIVRMNSATYANLPSYDNNTLYVVKD